jgi:hypothetical protein
MYISKIPKIIMNFFNLIISLYHLDKSNMNFKNSNNNKKIKIKNKLFHKNKL